MEFTALAKLADLFILLAKERIQSKERVFLDYVTPMFNEASTAYTDLRETLVDALTSLDGEGATVEELAKTIVQRRTKNRAVRQKLRSVIFEWRMTHQGQLPKFEAGILGVLLGGLSYYQRRGVALLDYDKPNSLPYLWGKGHHTLLDLLTDLRRAEVPPLWLVREWINDQINQIDKAWNDVSAGYAELAKAAGRLPKHD